jgi:ankyrin repeat protein
LLEKGANATATTKSGKTALNKAISEGNLGVATVLVRHEPRLITMKDFGGSTPLMWACENASSNKNGPLIVELLLRYGGNEIVNDVDIHKRTAFDRLCMSSGNVRSAQLLLKAGARTRNVASRTHLSHLMLCAMNGHKELCRELLERYAADPKSKNIRGFTAHQFAEINGHFLIAKIIQEKYQ